MKKGFLLLVSFVISSTPALADCLSLPKSFVVDPFQSNVVNLKQERVTNSLQEALVEFDAMLVKGGEELRTGWHNYLSWNAWALPFITTQTVHLKKMQEKANYFYGVNNGFDHAAFVKVRSALEAFIDFQVAKGAVEIETLATIYQHQTQNLVSLLRADQCDFARIEEVAAWLATLEQSPALLAQLRKTFSGPTMVISAEKSFVDESLNEFKNSKTKSESSGHMIQGAWVTGRSIVNSNASAAVKSSSDGRIRINVTGTVTSPHNVATKGPVQVHTRALTNWSAFSEIFWNGEEFGYTAPVVDAETKSTINYVDGPVLIRRIGARKAQKSKSAGEIEGAGIIRREIGGEMRGELDSALEQIKAKSNDVISLMRKAGVLPLRANTNLSDEALQIGLFPNSLSQINATPVSLPAEGGQFVLSVHENAIPKLVRRILGGAHWDDLKFAHLQKELTGTNTKEYLIGLTPERWSANWDWHSPIRVSFAPDVATFIFRYSSITIDGIVYDVPYQITSGFKISNTNLGMELTRISDVEVTPIDPSRKMDERVRQFVMRKFHGLFDNTLHLDGVHFPKGGDLNELSSLVLSDIKTEMHWLHLGISKAD